MELKPGYRMTEIGVIPEEWDLRELGSLTNLLTNGFVGTASSGYVDCEDGVLYIQGYNVQENGFNFHGIKRVSKSFHARHQKSCLQTGDLLTIQTGDIGVTVVVPSELAGANCHALIISRLNRQRSEPRFYSQYFNSARGRSAFKAIETGTTMKHLNCGDMKQLLLPSPPINEQRAIATALSDVDALIAGLEKLIAKKRDLKQAAMQQLLTGQTRLPGFDKEWQLLSLGGVVEKCVGGGTPSRANSSYWGGPVPWVTVKDFATFEPASAQEYITHEGLRNSASNLISAGTLITSTRMALGRAVIYDVDVAINQDLKALVFKKNVDVRFALFWFRHFERMIDELGSGSTVKGISIGELMRLPFSLPDFAEQSAISQVLTDMESELSLIEARLAKTRALKQGMMQELLTGRTRLI